MAFVIADRVRETTTSIGTGSVTLAGAYTSFQTFSAAIGNGNNTYYTIASATSGEWEVGIGTYASGGNLLSRDTVLASSASGAKVTFSSGTKDVFVTQPAERSLLLQSAGTGLFAGAAAFTANGLLYANSTTTVATGSVLTFDGSTLVNTGPLKVGSGVASNTSRLMVNNATNTATGIQLFQDGIESWIMGMPANSAGLAWSASGSEQMRLTSTGLGIGTSSPAGKLDSRGASYFGADSNNALYVDSTSSLVTIGAAGRSSFSTSALRFLTSDGTAALERMRLDSSGNLGLGVTPSNWVTVVPALDIAGGASVYGYSNGAFVSANLYYNGGYKYKAAAAASYYQQANANHYWWISTGAPSVGGAITFTQAMTLDASGNLLVGRTSALASEQFCVEGSVANFQSRIRNTSATTPFGVFVSYTAAAPNSTSSQFVRCDDNAATRAEIRSNGGLANYSGNNVNLSDRREKTNFAPAKSYLDVICAIPVQTFNYIDQSEDDPGLTLGVVAQDVQDVAPELVMESNWGTEDNPKVRLSIYQTDLQYALMKCIQEQQAIIKQLKADVAALKGA